MRVGSLAQENLLEKEMVVHSSILACGKSHGQRGLLACAIPGIHRGWVGLSDSATQKS